MKAALKLDSDSKGMLTNQRLLPAACSEGELRAEGKWEGHVRWRPTRHRQRGHAAGIGWTDSRQQHMMMMMMLLMWWWWCVLVPGCCWPR